MCVGGVGDTRLAFSTAWRLAWREAKLKAAEPLRPLLSSAKQGSKAPRNDLRAGGRFGVLTLGDAPASVLCRPCCAEKSRSGSAAQKRQRKTPLLGIPALVGRVAKKQRSSSKPPRPRPRGAAARRRRRRSAEDNAHTARRRGENAPPSSHGLVRQRPTAGSAAWGDFQLLSSGRPAFVEAGGPDWAHTRGGDSPSSTCSV